MDLIDEVGPWTEVKIEIVQEYATVFQKIITAKHRFHPIYMDAFSGSGKVVSETRGSSVESTPARIIKIKPPFEEYHFIERNPARKEHLDLLVGSEPNVEIHLGDSNEILLSKVLPTMKYKSFRKGLLFLDPYALHLDWKVIEAAGKSECVDVLLNFPIYAMNITVLRKNPSEIPPAQIEQMNFFFGDEQGWRQAAYETPMGLFGPMLPTKKLGNEPILQAYLNRLTEVAGFEFVSKPLPMKNLQGAIVYYLIGASQASAAVRAFNGVFNKWKKRGVSIVPAEHDRVD